MASLGKRILGGIVDTIIIIAFNWIFAGMFGTTSMEAGTASFGMTGFPAVIMFVSILAYFIVMEKIYGKTVGKMVAGTKVVSEGGGSISWGQSVIRNLMRIVDGLPVFYIVGMIAIAASKKNQRVGDMVAKTKVT